MTKHGSNNVRSAAEQMTAEPLDVLVVGGGIVGSGVARDAAMRGLRVGLVEQHDLAFGTSSRSSRMLHGGLRYLAQGRLRMVREASVEKCTLARIAPHLTQPLPFLFPTYRRTGWPLWQLRIGVKIYDLLCGGHNFGRSQGLNARQVRELLPGLNPDRLTGAVRYFDALTHDARLVIDTLRSAAKHGALVQNYCRFEHARPERRVWACQARDAQAGRVLPIRTHTIVNAAGPWADQLPHSRLRLRLTKGIHLVVARDRLPLPTAVVMTDGKRILFGLPWGERVVVGTTDTDYDGRIEDVCAEPTDIRYVLRAANRLFPQAVLTQGDVLATWAGLRPLIADKRGRPSDMSRRHEIRQTEPGWWDVAGGKLTTYRLMAEQTVDQIVKHLRRHTPPCRTADEPLLPPEQVEGLSGILPPEGTREAVEHFCRWEWAVHLDDVMVRRTSWHYALPDRAAVAEQVASWMADALGWSDERQRDELEAYRRTCA